MSTTVYCYIRNCDVAPVFKCSCTANTYSCHGHCFQHIQSSCNGKLTPYFSIPSSSYSSKIKSELKSITMGKFETLASNEILLSLFPNETCVFQCGMCGKLVAKSFSADHTCERSEIDVMNIEFRRANYNLYECLKCHQVVHTSFLVPHADLHNKLKFSSATEEDISLVTSLIIKKSQEQKVPSVPDKKFLKKESEKPACLSTPFASSLPYKRPRHEF